MTNQQNDVSYNPHLVYSKYSIDTYLTIEKKIHRDSCRLSNLLCVKIDINKDIQIILFQDKSDI